MRSASIIVRYAACCALAMMANLGMQFLAREGFGQPLIVCLIFGTGAGLVLKYVLDRNFIFEGRGVGLRRDSARFIIYSLFGLVTTMLFWGAEWAATLISHHPYSLYFGGALGLVVGYAIKYYLDRRWVFGRQVPSS